jgi:hypothetical protein
MHLTGEQLLAQLAVGKLFMITTCNGEQMTHSQQQQQQRQ